MLTSSVPALKGALLARWSALAEVTTHNDVRVSWGNPFPDKMPDVLLIIDDTKDHELRFAAGMTQANETYSVSCYISVAKNPRNNRQEQWQRVYDLYFAVINDIATMNTTGAMPEQVNVIEVRPSRDVDALAMDLRETSIMFDLAITARLS